MKTFIFSFIFGQFNTYICIRSKITDVKPGSPLEWTLPKKRRVTENAERDTGQRQWVTNVITTVSWAEERNRAQEGRKASPDRPRAGLGRQQQRKEGRSERRRFRVEVTGQLDVPGADEGVKVWVQAASRPSTFEKKTRFIKEEDDWIIWTQREFQSGALIAFKKTAHPTPGKVPGEGTDAPYKIGDTRLYSNRETVRDAEIWAEVTRTGVLLIRQKEEPKQKRTGGNELWENI